MSGFISAIGRASNLATGIGQSARALGNIFSGAAFGSSGPVTLGGFSFQGYEVPESISWGGRQQMTVHRLPGGERVIDAMGPDDRDLTWSGVFLSVDAEQRAQTLDQMRRAGQPIILAWGTFNFLVVISSFEATSRRASWLPYRISCTVLPRDAPPLATTTATAGALSGITSALGSVSSGISAIASTAQSVVSTAQQVVGSVASVVTPITNALGINVPFLSQAEMGLSVAQGAVNGLSSAASGINALAGATTALGTANDLVRYGVSQTGTALSQIASAATSGIVSVGNLAVAAVSAGEHAVLTQAQGLVGQAAINLGLAASTPPVTTLAALNQSAGGPTPAFAAGGYTFGPTFSAAA